MKTIPAICCLLTGFTLSAAGAGWSQWRGPQHTGVSTEENLPVRWSTTENVAWKLAMPAKTGSTPRSLFPVP